MKKMFIIASLLLIGGGGYSSADVKLAHYWSFDEVPKGDAPVELKDDVEYAGQWTLEKKTWGSDVDYPKNTVWQAEGFVNNDYSKFGYSTAFGNFYHMGATSKDTAGEYLTCAGTEMDFSQAWSYSITAWIRPEVTGQMTLFSIGSAGEGFQLVYDSGDDNSLKFTMHGSESNFGKVSLGGAFGGESDFRHIGFSMSNDGKGQLTVNYYVNGTLFKVDTPGDVSKLLGKKIDQFNIGADGNEGTMLGSCNYDEIKIFTGVLDEEDIKEAMKKGPGNFEINNPSVPEPSTVLLFALGGSLCLLRRRRVA